MELKDFTDEYREVFGSVDWIRPECVYLNEEPLKNDFSNAIISGYHAEIFLRE